MSKFVLIDPSIVAKGGHYLGYAEGVLKAAAKAGFEPWLFANAAFAPSTPPKGYAWRALFEFDIWARAQKHNGLKNWRDEPDLRSLLRARYGRAGLLWEASKDPQGLSHYSSAFPPRATLTRRLGATAKLRVLAEEILADKEALVRARGHEPDQERGLHFSLLRESIREAGRRLKQGAAAGPGERSAAMAEMSRRSAAAASFADRFRKMARELALGEDDHVFLPTLAFHDLAGLGDALACEPALRKPVYHLLCRRDIYRGYSHEFDRQEWTVHEFRFALHAFHAAAGEARVHFYTDTDELTAQYDRLDAFRFGTLPVPVAVDEAASRRDCSDARDVTIGVVISPGRKAAEDLATMAEHSHADVFGLPCVRIVACDEFGSPGPGSASTGGGGVVPVIAARGSGWADALCDAVDVLALADREAPGGRAELIKRASKARKTVVLSAGLQEAVHLGRQGTTLHELLINARGAVLSEVGPDPKVFSWRRYYGEGRDVEEPGVCDGQGVTATRNGLTYTQVDAPSGATHFWLHLPIAVDASISNGSRPVTELITAYKIDSGSGQPDRVHYITHAARSDSERSGFHSLLLEAPPNATSIWVGLRAFVSDGSGFRLSSFRCRWVRIEGPAPALAGYVPYAPGESYMATLGKLGDAIATVAADAPGQTALAPFWPKTTGPVLAHRRTLVGAYLGDAREEKGFHLLPDVIKRLAADPLRGSRLRYHLQAYAPLGVPDVRMLMAIDRLEEMRREKVELVRRAMDGAEYNQLLTDSDFVFVTYSRTNYTARSSGVFAEAMAAAKPVIVPAGTWMSRIIDEASAAYHDAIVQPSWILADENLLRSVRWTKDGIANPIKGRSVALVRLETSYTQFQPVDGATHMRLTFAHDGRFPDQHSIMVVAQFSDPNGVASSESVEVAKRVQIFGGVGDRRISFVMPIVTGCNRIWLGFYCAFGSGEIELVEPRAIWLKAPIPIAEAPFGVKYLDEGSDETRSDAIGDALGALVDAFDAFRASFAIAAPDWGARNSYTTLVEAMLRRSGLSETFWPRRRLSARDW